MICTRRRFLEQSSSAAAVAAVWGCGSEPGVDSEAPQENQAAETPLGPRRTLAEPGPMVPPVPAVLLTINGAEGDPAEISVLWTFVVNRRRLGSAREQNTSRANSWSSTTNSCSTFRQLSSSRRLIRSI